MQRLKEVVMLLIANDAPLPAEWLDHELTGEWSNAMPRAICC
jgi:mRNA interferase YafQ